MRKTKNLRSGLLRHGYRRIARRVIDDQNGHSWKNALNIANNMCNRTFLVQTRDEDQQLFRPGSQFRSASSSRADSKSGISKFVSAQSASRERAEREIGDEA